MPRLVLLVVAIAVIATPSVARAGSAVDAIHRECQSDRITGTYTQKQYADALRTINTDLDEYTDCRDVIRRAQLAAAGKRSHRSDGTATGGPGSSGPGGRSAPPGAPASTSKTAALLLAQASPTEQAAVAKASRSSGDAPIVVGGKAISPGSSRSPAGGANTIPAPLVVALVFVGLALAGGGASTLRSLARTRRTLGG